MVSKYQLTRRQMQIVELVATGLTNRQVAERLQLSPLTVRNALSAVYDRLGTGSRAYLAASFSDVRVSAIGTYTLSATSGALLAATSSAFSIAATTPSAPAITGVTAGDSQLSAAYTAPSSTGGTAITNYEYSTDGGGTWVARSPASLASPLVIRGLVNDTAYSVRIRAVNSVGAGAASNAVTGTPVAGVPVNTALPAISGTLSNGQTLTATTGTWTANPSPTFSYQWQRCDSTGGDCAAISGATGTTYSLGNADRGATLRVVVTATNSQGSTAATSAATSVVGAAPAPPVNTVLLWDGEGRRRGTPPRRITATPLPQACANVAYPHTKALDYRGPRFGWWTVPDQFALARLDALEGSRPGVPREPLFVFFPTTSTHAPFGPTAPYEPDWNRVTSATPYDDADVEAARARTPKWFDLGPSYANAVGYMYASIGGYLRRHAGRPLVMVVIGDHQPAAAVSGEGASWDVPVHVIAPPGLLLDRLRARGFRPGLTPGRPHLGPMHDLLPTLLDAFGDTRRDTRGHAPTRSPATE